MLRPGLSKRKRVTLGSSRASEQDVWHSTPVDNVTEEEELDESPIPKRGATDSTPAQLATVATPRLMPTPINRKAYIALASTPVPSPPVVISAPSGHNYFSTVLQKHGFILSKPRNHMRLDSMVFRRKLSAWLKENNDESHRIQNDTSKFLTAMNEYLLVKENLSHAVTPTVHPYEFFQPSLLNCILGVDFLQPHVLKVIVPVLAELSFSLAPNDVESVIELLNQLKWLPGLVNGKELTANLLNVVEHAEIAVRKEIIRFLPEILPTEFHSTVGECLMKLFDNGSQIANVLMDCFSSLDIPDQDWNRVRDAALDQMFQAPLSDFPAFFAFLFRTDAQETLESVITSMRENLKIRPTGKDSKNQMYMVEIVHKLRFCMSINPSIVTVWNKQVKDDISSGVEIQSLDLIMLFIFSESYTSATDPLTLLLSDHALAIRLFDEIMEYNKPIVYQVFPRITGICDSILRGKDSKSCHGVADVLVKLFIGLSPLEAQTIIGNLTSVLVNDTSSCRDIVLKIFSDIADAEPKKLLMFAPHLMGVLNYIMKFPPSQIRTIMNVLAILAHIPGSRESNPFNAEFSILLRKQLSHPCIEMRSFGVLGAIATIRQLALQERSMENDGKIQDLLNLAWSFVEREEDSCRIFFDELSDSLATLPIAPCVHFRDILKDKFQSIWTVDQASDSQLLAKKIGQAGIRLCSTMDANKEVEREKLVLIFEGKPMEMSPVVIPSHVRVFISLEGKCEGGDLKEIDAILGCPIFFPSLEVYYGGENLEGLTQEQKHHLGQYLTLAINFFRESVSGFVDEVNLELRIKIWFRLSNIVCLQKLLVTHFSSFPSLPIAYAADKTVVTSTFDFGGHSSEKSIGKKKSNKQKQKPTSSKKKGGGKKKISKQQIVGDDSSDSSSDESSITEGPILGKLEDEIQPIKLIPYLRRFDQKVFKLLKYPLSFSPEDLNCTQALLNLWSEDKSASEVIRDVEQLTLHTLTFLLTELNQQACDAKLKFDLLTVDELLNSILCHLESIISVYEQDSSTMDDITERNICTCFRLLLKTQTAYFESINCSLNRQNDIAKSNILVIAARTVPGSTEEAEKLPLIELSAEVATYLGNYVSCVKEPSTAVDHIKLLKNVHDLIERKEPMEKAIESVIKTYLKRDWKLSSAEVDFFLRTWLSVSSNPLKVIRRLSEKIIPMDNMDIPCSDFYKCCSKINFHTWFTILVKGMAQHVHKYGRKMVDVEESFTLWSEAFEILKILVHVPQKIKKKIILNPLLKFTRIFFEAFTIGGVPLLPQIWSTDPNKAQVFCRSLQNPTRRVQYVCEHSKVSKDAQLMRYVPLVKRSLETLLFRIREVLTSNGTASAFWMGSLKHRNLDGDVMNSQPFNIQDDISNSDEEEEEGLESDVETLPDFEGIGNIDVEEEIVISDSD